MTDVSANFSISNQSFNAGFELSENTSFDALFSINAEGAVWGEIDGNIEDQTDLKNALAAKQNTISDLETIRSGASLGTTSIQPNDNISELTNDSGYITKSVNNLDNYTKTSDLGDLALKDTVDYETEITNKPTIPTVNNNTITIKQGTETKGSFTLNQNTDETITLDMGGGASSFADLTGSPYDNSNLSTALNSKQGTLTAGSNITISDDTISATDTTYTAGSGLTLTGTEFSANVVNNVTSSSTVNALSANMGKELQDQITNLKQRGRYLSVWNCTTGLATTEPTVNPYTYKAGDYFIVGFVGTTNYRPNGSQYTGTASTTVDSSSISVNDTYYYDGTVWTLLHGADVSVTFASIGGQPSDNSNLASALNAKQDVLTAGSNIQINNNTISATDTTYTAGTGITISNNTISADQEIFDVTYGTTTYAEIETALTNSLVPVCHYNNRIYYYVYTAGNVHYLVCDFFPFIYILRCYLSAPYWAEASVISEQTGNKVTTISASSTDTQYPSAKAVYGYHDSTKQDTLVSGTNIKTINSTSLLGSGNVAVQSTLVSGTNIKTINSQSLLGSGDISIASPSVVQIPGTSTTSVMSQNAVGNFIVSRGENLVTNGFATLGNNYNFSGLTFDGTDSYGTGGCFTRTGKYQNLGTMTNEYMPIDTSKVYEFSAYVKRDVAQSAGTTDYYYLDMYDIDKYPILDTCVFSWTGTTTTLAQDLNNGDTVAYLTDTSNWATSTATNPYAGQMQVFDYQNSFGYTYPDYTRNIIGATIAGGGYNGKYFNPSDIDTTNNTITFSVKAWNKGTIPAGTKVAQAKGGGYYYFLFTPAQTANTWEQIKGYTQPMRYRAGTAFARIGAIINISTSATYKICGISFTANPTFPMKYENNQVYVGVPVNGALVWKQITS